MRAILSLLGAYGFSGVVCAQSSGLVSKWPEKVVSAITVEPTIPQSGNANELAGRPLAPGAYQSNPHTLWVLVPDSTQPAMPKMTLPATSGAGIMRLPTERLRKPKQ